MFGPPSKDHLNQIDQLNKEHDNRVTCLINSTNFEVERRRYAEKTLQLIGELIDEGKGVDAIRTLVMLRNSRRPSA